jgi:hypothetical protein
MQRYKSNEKEKRIIYMYNEFHFGDCVFCCNMFSHIKKYIEENNIFIQFYCNSENISQVTEFNQSKNISIFSLENKPNGVEIYNLWIANPECSYNFYSRNNDPYDVFLCNFYNNFLEKINIPIKIEKLLYKDDDLLTRYNDINSRTNNKYKNIDFLIVNGKPLSFQFDYIKEEWDDFIKKLNAKYNVVTTDKVEDIKCTRDDGLTLKDIAAISTKAKIIVTIDTGPAAGFYNVYTMDYVDKIYILHNENTWAYPKFVTTRSLSELNFLTEGNDAVSKLNVNDNTGSYYYWLFLFLLVLFFVILIFYYFLQKKNRKLFWFVKR